MCYPTRHFTQAGTSVVIFTLIASADTSVLLCTVILVISDNVELTSNKERQFTCPGDLVTFTCRVFGSFSLEWRSPLITQTIAFTAIDTPPISTNRGPFTISLIDVSPSSTPVNTNFTSTLQVTASTRDATTVMCLSTSDNKTDNFTVAGNLVRYRYYPV